MDGILSKISEEMLDGNSKEVQRLIEEAISGGIDASDILEQGLMAGMDVVGVKFRSNEFFVPEVLVAARAMNKGMAVLKPHLAKSGVKPVGKALLGSVKGDLHDIGKNIVRMMFEGKGIEVKDLGVDVPPEKFVEAYKEEKADIIALSALLTTTMEEMKNTVDAFIDAGLRDDVIIMVGGAPVSDKSRIAAGADLYADDAVAAAEAAKQALVMKSGA